MGRQNGIVEVSAPRHSTPESNSPAKTAAAPLCKPFSTLLIANRGEIACRIIRSARLAGLRTVAVYSEADRDAVHVRQADEALFIGGAAPALSYLNISRIIAAAKSSGADAVHPGYGFLAENAAFAQACADAGLVFVGPPAAAIAAMGNKAGAKILMKKAGVPCIPGFEARKENEQEEAALTKAAAIIGYPVMIKAAAGGGGRGMRRVETADAFAAALRAARSEAQSAFGSGELILERALDAPRHIEIQVFADSQGNTIHLGERDCSVQRRHQKIIEEAPSPAVSAGLREKMGAAAVAAARSIGYVGAGTVEFLLDAGADGKEGAFYFMEMNTRLQVEHAVTEAATGLDLVAMQLAVAAGNALPFAQQDVRFSGHAIEARLCAEDPAREFLPQSGTMHLWHAPSGVRVDHALESGARIPPHYDSMIAKLVAHGDTREIARMKLLAALEDCTVLGVGTNGAFLAACLAHPEFTAGNATTDFIPRFFPPAARAEAAVGSDTLALATVLFHERAADGAPYSPELRNWSSNAAMSTPLKLLCGEIMSEVRVSPVAANGYRIDTPAGKTMLGVVDRGDTEIRFSLAGIEHHARYCWADGTLLLAFAGRSYSLRNALLDPPRPAAGAGTDGRVVSPMNGRVVAIHVAAGDEVEAGSALLVLEAMKMEHPVTAPFGGRIAEIAAAVGEQVAPGRLLVSMRAKPS
jgi:geranyl-CoA carboxylase alpha subunit